MRPQMPVNLLHFLLHILLRPRRYIVVGWVFPRIPMGEEARTASPTGPAISAEHRGRSTARQSRGAQGFGAARLGRGCSISSVSPVRVMARRQLRSSEGVVNIAGAPNAGGSSPGAGALRPSRDGAQTGAVGSFRVDHADTHLDRLREVDRLPNSLI